MMRRCQFVCGALAALACPALAQQHVWNQQVLHNPFKDTVSQAIDPAVDGTLMYVADYQQVPFLPLTPERPLVVRMDDCLSPIRWTTYRIPNEGQVNFDLRPREIFATSDNGSIVCGEFSETSLNGQLIQDGAYLLRLDPGNNVVWFRVYDRIESFYDIIEVSDLPGTPLQFVACGWRITSPNDLGTAVAVGTDGVGNIIWERDAWAVKNGVRGRANYEQVIETRTGEYALVGNCNRIFNTVVNAEVESDVLVTRLDAGGNPLLNRWYGQSPIMTPVGNFGVVEHGYSIDLQPVAGGVPNLVIGGDVIAQCLQSCQFPTFFHDVLAFQINQNGAPGWSNRYDIAGNVDIGRHITAPAGRVTVSGESTTPAFTPTGTTSRDVLALRLDALGNAALPSEVFGGPRADYGAQHLPTPNLTALGTYILATTESFGVPFPMPYLIQRFDSQCRDCNSRSVQPVVNAHQMPTITANNEPFQQQGTFRELFAVDPQLVEDVLCKKCLIGDMNCDGFVTVGDISPFVLAITNPAGYEAAFPDCCLESADVNCDGFVTVGDISPFVALLTGP